MNAAKAISESNRITGLGRGCGVLFGGVFFAFGAFFLWIVLLQPVLMHFQAKSWPSAEAQVTFSEVHVSHDSDGDTYRPDIRFKYEAGGQKFVSDTYSFENMSYSNRSWARDVVAKYPVGSQHTCYYNAGDLGEAVLVRDLPGWGTFLFGLIPLVFASIGGWVVYRSLTHDRQRQTGSAHGLQLDSQKPDVAGAPWVGNEGPRKLKPESPRWAAVVALAGAGLFWNTITWMIVYAVVRDEGIFSFPMLFLSLFVVIGIGTVLGFIYQLMALWNPVVEVAFSEAAVPIGDTVDIAWELVGNGSRLSKLKLAIVGCEQATYQRGTDTATDTKEFVRIPITETSDPEEICFGSTTLQIPSHTMHSFDARNNKVIWKVEVKGVIPWWPDVNDTYTFYVRPRPTDGSAWASGGGAIQ